MNFGYWLLCWICYYLGDLSSRILNIFDDNERWVKFWFPVYNELMAMSSTAQDLAGKDPAKVDDVSWWVWSKAPIEEENKGENDVI